MYCKLTKAGAFRLLGRSLTYYADGKWQEMVSIYKTIAFVATYLFYVLFGQKHFSDFDSFSPHDANCDLNKTRIFIT